MEHPHFGQGAKLLIQTGLAEDADFERTQAVPGAPTHDPEPALLEPVQNLHDTLGVGQEYPLDPSDPFDPAFSSALEDPYGLTFEDDPSYPTPIFEPSDGQPDFLS